MVSNCEIGAQSLIERGYAVLEDDSNLLPLVHAAFSEGLRFFGQADVSKRDASVSKIIEGYLPMMSEFSVTEQRPDLCEGFAVWRRNSDDPDVKRWAPNTPLHVAMTATLPIYTGLANAIFEALRQKFNPHGDVLLDSEASYLQMNQYRPADHERDLLQDPHEDGHMLTVLRPTARGCEIRIGGEFTHIEIPDNAVLLMPGSLLTIMTGGVIPPLFHRVRNDRSTAIRQSMMYFINPTMLAETYPWIENETNRGASIRTTAIQNSKNFGLPSLEKARKNSLYG